MIENMSSRRKRHICNEKIEGGGAPRAEGTAALGCKAKRFEPQYLYYFCVVCSYFPRKGIGVAAKQPPSEIYVLVRQSPLKSVLTRAEKIVFCVDK